MRSLLLGIGAAQLFQLPLTAQRTAPAEVPFIFVNHLLNIIVLFFFNSYTDGTHSMDTAIW